jgi:hypothetical protein
LLFAKLPFFPLGVVPLAYSIWRKPLLRTAVRILAGFVIFFTMILSVLNYRGELNSFVEDIIENVRYSNDPTVISSTTFFGRIYSHLEQVIDPGFLGSYASVFVIAGAGIFKRLSYNSTVRSLSWITIALTLTSLGILALTGLWWHHGQIVFIPGLIALIILVSLLRQFLPMDGDISTVTLASIGAFFSRRLSI